MSRGDEKGKASAGSSAQADKNAAAEDQIAREKALKDANERVGNLQKNIQEMQKLLEMKNKSGADLQAQSAKPAEAAKAAGADIVGFDDLAADILLFHMVGYSRVSERVDFMPTMATNSQLQLSEIGFK